MHTTIYWQEKIFKHAVARANQSLHASGDIDDEFASTISNQQFIEIVDTASQSYQPTVTRTNAPTVAPNAPKVLRANAPTVSLTHAATASRAQTPTVASAIPPTSSSFNASDVMDNEFFDCSISNEQLMEIVDNASQSYQQQAGNDIGGGEIDDAIHEMMNEGNTEAANSAVATQSTTNSVLNSIMAQSFKSVNFGRMSNCNFNFYFTK